MQRGIKNPCSKKKSDNTKTFEKLKKKQQRISVKSDSVHRRGTYKKNTVVTAEKGRQDSHCAQNLEA